MQRKPASVEAVRTQKLAKPAAAWPSLPELISLMHAETI
jgi:hypothetical protein